MDKQTKNQLRECENMLQDTTIRLSKYHKERQILVEELRNARRMLKEAMPKVDGNWFYFIRDLAFIVDALHTATREIDVITYAVYQQELGHALW